MGGALDGIDFGIGSLRCFVVTPGDFPGDAYRAVLLCVKALRLVVSCCCLCAACAGFPEEGYRLALPSGDELPGAVPRCCFCTGCDSFPEGTYRLVLLSGDAFPEAVLRCCFCTRCGAFPEGTYRVLSLCSEAFRTVEPCCCFRPGCGAFPVEPYGLPEPRFWAESGDDLPVRLTSFVAGNVSQEPLLPAACADFLLFALPVFFASRLPFISPYFESRACALTRNSEFVTGRALPRLFLTAPASLRATRFIFSPFRP